MATRASFYILCVTVFVHGVLYSLRELIDWYRTIIVLLYWALR